MKNLRTLRLEYCYLNNDSVASVIGRLRTLVIVRLRGSEITQLPHEFKHLSNLRLLDLTGCSDLTEILRCVISSLSQLEELYMWYSFQNWVVQEGGGRDKHTRRSDSRDLNVGTLSELLSLRRLTSLEIFLPPIDKVQNSKLFHKLERFKISIGWEHKIVLNPNHSDNYLRLHDLNENTLAGCKIMVLLKKTDTLELKMKHLKEPLNILDTKYGWVKLKSLRLEGCGALKYLVDMTHMAPFSVFPVLNSLKIFGAINLKEIFHGQLPIGSLKELRDLSLWDLPALTHFLKIESHSDLKNLGLVEELNIQRCQLLEDIVSLGQSRSHEEEASEFNFSNLTCLTLQDLPSQIGISKNIHMVHFPQLIRLVLNIRKY